MLKRFYPQHLTISFALDHTSSPGPTTVLIFEGIPCPGRRRRGWKRQVSEWVAQREVSLVELVGGRVAQCPRWHHGPRLLCLKRILVARWILLQRRVPLDVLSEILKRVVMTHPPMLAVAVLELLVNIKVVSPPVGAPLAKAHVRIGHVARRTSTVARHMERVLPNVCVFVHILLHIRLVIKRVCVGHLYSLFLCPAPFRVPLYCFSI